MKFNIRIPNTKQLIKINCFVELASIFLGHGEEESDNNKDQHYLIQISIHVLYMSRQKCAQ